mmetsp:Transcript_19751/g.27574  ORF Transcript_19751/g.27574 Transcript_19751/m.27574 type:complete len:475 (+) Transcript_19751:212-1636(+)|eukprot:CAMPEP_0184496276 /NCGR_PEP_ID=MMETSP0113_2-20130426/33530_1 /TAXON_ID=91329 /ORGANISM="Norrisiella sphaerica, Strain BC52" /LENGTH=474 /DNA_ID=CAMNT_0026882833 /DNA_START=192 /DNA_END=1616 /DNA_ORIENTATION=+
MSVTLEQCVRELQGMFPSIASDVIKLVLESNALNVDATVEALIKMHEEAAPKPKSKLRQLLRKLEECKLEMKEAAAKQDFHVAAKKKDQMSALETAIQSDLAHGHKYEELNLEIHLAKDGKAGFDFKYHSGGWDVTKVGSNPGQTELREGDRIVSVGGSPIKGVRYKDQLTIWKTAAVDKRKIPATIIRFQDASTGERQANKEKSGGEPSNSSSNGDRKTRVSSKKSKEVGETPEGDRKIILMELNNGLVPDSFLRPPSYYTEGRSTKVQSQEEMDAQLARLLQDQMFMEDLRNNPDAYLNQTSTGNQHQRTQGRRNQRNGRTEARRQTGDISGTGSAQPKQTFKERMSKLGALGKERLARIALFFQKKKKESQRGQSPDAELVPLADDLPLAPDLDGSQDGQFVIESDEDLGVGAAADLDDEGHAMAKLVRQVGDHDSDNKASNDDLDMAGAVSVDLPGGDAGRKKEELPEFL